MCPSTTYTTHANGKKCLVAFQVFTSARHVCCVGKATPTHFEVSNPGLPLETPQLCHGPPTSEPNAPRARGNRLTSSLCKQSIDFHRSDSLGPRALFLRPVRSQNKERYLVDGRWLVPFWGGYRSTTRLVVLWPFAASPAHLCRARDAIPRRPARSRCAGLGQTLLLV